jgi:hypothetical protein
MPQILGDATGLKPVAKERTRFFFAGGSKNLIDKPLKSPCISHRRGFKPVATKRNTFPFCAGYKN